MKYESQTLIKRIGSTLIRSRIFFYELFMLSSFLRFVKLTFFCRDLIARKIMHINAFKSLHLGFGERTYANKKTLRNLFLWISSFVGELARAQAIKPRLYSIGVQVKQLFGWCAVLVFHLELNWKSDTSAISHGWENGFDTLCPYADSSRKRRTFTSVQPPVQRGKKSLYYFYWPTWSWIRINSRSTATPFEFFSSHRIAPFLLLSWVARNHFRFLHFFSSIFPTKKKVRSSLDSRLSLLTANEARIWLINWDRFSAVETACKIRINS